MINLQKQSDEYIITYELLDLMFNYFKRQPFEDVFHIMNSLNQLRPVPDPKEEQPDDQG